VAKVVATVRVVVVVLLLSIIIVIIKHRQFMSIYYNTLFTNSELRLKEIIILHIVK